MSFGFLVFDKLALTPFPAFWAGLYNIYLDCKFSEYKLPKVIKDVQIGDGITNKIDQVASFQQAVEDLLLQKQLSANIATTHWDCLGFQQLAPNGLPQFVFCLKIGSQQQMYLWWQQGFCYVENSFTAA